MKNPNEIKTDKKSYKNNLAYYIGYVTVKDLDVSKRIDVNKTNGLLEYTICIYYYFLEINFKFQPKVCNDFHDLMYKSVFFNDIVVSDKINYYILNILSKDEAITFFKKHACLSKKSGAFQGKTFFITCQTQVKNL